MKYLSICLIFAASFFSACETCYDCTKDCGTCTQGFVVIPGCDGDPITNGISVQAWAIALRAQGYTCIIVPQEKEICGSSSDVRKEKDSLEKSSYRCRKK